MSAKAFTISTRLRLCCTSASPENTVLSHDLLEGTFARAALASDIEVVEEFPSRYDVEISRQHRWMRGDWQLLPWIFSTGRDLIGGRNRTRIPLLARWKMLDNLRRSLSAPATLLALLWGWTLPMPADLRWTAFVLATIVLPPLLPLVAAIIPHRVGISRRTHIRNLARDVTLALTQILFVFTFMARAAWLSLDAVGRTIFRLFISRRHLLEWVSFARSAYGRHTSSKGFALQIAGSFAFAAISLALILVTQKSNAPFVTLFLALWAFSPAIARWASHPRDVEPHLGIDATQREELRLVARRTWRFFETFVGGDDNMLPPDNFQEVPKPVVAHRTSPTNIGLYIISVLAARDFGWIGTAETVERLEATLATMDRLERYRGHFLNWYENPDLGRARTALCFIRRQRQSRGQFADRQKRGPRNCSSPVVGRQPLRRHRRCAGAIAPVLCRRHTTQVTFNPNDPVRDRGDRAFAAHPFCR